jgi:PEP-CTERM motif-containing protein
VTELNDLQAGEFVLARLMFNTLAPGTSSLGFVVNALSDADGNSLTANTANGSVTVNSRAAVPEPNTLLLLGSGLAGLLAFRRRQQHV